MIRAHCAQIGARLQVVPPLRLTPEGSEVTGRLASGARFRAPLGLATLLETVGAHQRQNAALAVAAAEALVRDGLPLTAAAVAAGLRDAWMPTRLELARRQAGRGGAIAAAGSFATASEARVALGLEAVVTGTARRAWLSAGGLDG